jgi:hypothetical protein
LQLAPAQSGYKCAGTKDGRPPDTVQEEGGQLQPRLPKRRKEFALVGSSTHPRLNCAALALVGEDG